MSGQPMVSGGEAGARELRGSAAHAGRPAEGDAPCHGNDDVAIGARLAMIVAAHRDGDLDAAEQGYLDVLASRPDDPDAMHFLGVLRHQQGHSEEAVTLLSRAAEALPRHPTVHHNLGNVHRECGRYAEAEACYRRVLQIEPTNFMAIANLATVLADQHRYEDALRAYDLLLRIAPDHADGHFLFGWFLSRHVKEVKHEDGAELNCIELAVACFRKAISLDPGHLCAMNALGKTLYALGRHDEAGEVYRDWIQRQPEDPIPAHMLAACGGAPPPPRASDAYVRNTFDVFASDFDEQLICRLGYRAPQLLADVLAPILSVRKGDILDAGCGTGLCGPLLHPYARSLIGVDLSPRMLDRARRRQIYDALEEGELTAFLQARSDAFDVVVSADTLVYFGDLAEVARAAAAALRPGGALAFTVEALDVTEDEVRLGASGRYLHSGTHVERVLAEAGFRSTMHRDVLRREGGEDVVGWVVLARMG